jgi:hypothetical protein
MRIPERGVPPCHHPKTGDYQTVPHGPTADNYSISTPSFPAVCDHALSGPPPHFFRRWPKFGSFCTFHSPAEPRPTRGLSLPTYPSPSKFGFVLHNFLRHWPSACPNWVRFVRFTPRARPRPTRHPLPIYPSPSKFGFVLRIYRPAGPNWVRFAHFASGARPHPVPSNPQSPIRNMSLRGAERRGNLGAPGPSCLTLDPSNLKLSRRETIESPSRSWEWCHSLWMTVSDRRRRRPHLHK